MSVFFCCFYCSLSCWAYNGFTITVKQHTSKQSVKLFGVRIKLLRVVVPVWCLRWAACSSKGSVVFPCFLSAVPRENWRIQTNYLPFVPCWNIFVSWRSFRVAALFWTLRYCCQSLFSKLDYVLFYKCMNKNGNSSILQWRWWWLWRICEMP